MKQKKQITLEEIERFIIESGSDDLGVFGGEFVGGVHCQQIPDEIAPCIMAILDSGKAIKNYLEIGVAAGGTTFLFNHFFALDKIVLIDDNEHQKAIVRPYVLKGINTVEIVGDSHSYYVLEKVRDLDLSFDLIMVDGDHNYAGVKSDIDNYLPYLNEGGFLVLHDSYFPGCEVVRLMPELKADGRLKFIGEYLSMKHSVLGVALFQKVGA